MLMGVVIQWIPAAREVVRIYPARTKKPPPRA